MCLNTGAVSLLGVDEEVDKAQEAICRVLTPPRSGSGERELKPCVAADSGWNRETRSRWSLSPPDAGALPADPHRSR